MAISKEDAPFLQLINNKYMLTMYTHLTLSSGCCISKSQLQISMSGTCICSSNFLTSIMYPQYIHEQVAWWCNGIARLQQQSCCLQGPGFEFHLRPEEYSVQNKVSPISNRIRKQTSVPCVLIIQSEAIRGCM